MSLDEAMDGDGGARQESYRAAARAAVAELDEIEAVTLALQARIAKLRTRATHLTALLEVLEDVVPDAARRPRPWEPPALLPDAPAADAAELPRRRRRREERPDGHAVESPGEVLDDLPVRVGPRAAPGPDLRPEDVLRTGLADGRHAGPASDLFTPLPADVEAWG